MNVCEVSAIIMLDIPTKKCESLLKKRHNQWAHEMCKITSFPQRILPLFYGDRFIPRRYDLVDKNQTEKFIFKGEKEDMFDNLFLPNYWRHQRVKLAINDSFGIKTRRVLEFDDLGVKNKFVTSFNVLPQTANYEVIYGNLNGFDWPCKPRSKPYAFADTTHDLPEFDWFSDLNLVDWSVNGEIAASFGRHLVLWKPSADLTMVYRITNSRAIAYCPNGNYLAVGCTNLQIPVLELWDMKQLCIMNGHVFDSEQSEVLCIQWNKSGNIVVCGTQLGAVYVLSVPDDLAVVCRMKDHKQPVSIIKFSPTMRYMATGDTEGNIFIYNWNSCDVHVVLRSKRKLHVIFDWHPWNGVDLAIAEDIPASIVILHVPTKEIVAYYQRKDNVIKVNSITFSKITAELIVSFSNKGVDGCIVSEILVMSSLDRIVDVLRVPDGSVRFMMWSPDGLQLATAGNDETLTIWNFFSYKGQKSFLKIANILSERKKKKFPFGCSFGREFTYWSSLK